MYTGLSITKGHGQIAKVGLVVTNLGSPSAPTRPALRRYLKQFLSDPRVVEFPRALWWFVLNGIILNIRPSRSAKTYTKIWTQDGSPLSHIMASLTSSLRDHMRSKHDPEKLVVDYAMRYGEPSIENVIKNMQTQGVQRLIVLPLYPHYSASTTASTFDEFARVLKELRWQPSLDFLPPYYDQPEFIDSISKSVTDFRDKNGAGELLIFSYHGVPQKYLHKGDPYHCQCLKTSRLVMNQLGLDHSNARTFFQSRFGREPWLQPYTDLSLEKLAEQGYKNIDIICPGFSIDCLETLEEIQMEAQQTFVDAGGETLNYIPCLNDTAPHVALIDALVNHSLQHHLSQVRNQYDHALSETKIQSLLSESPNRTQTTEAS